MKLASNALAALRDFGVLTGIKKKYSVFIDLYEEYLKYSNFISAWEKYEEKKSAIGALDYGDMNKITLWYLDVCGTQELKRHIPLHHN